MSSNFRKLLIANTVFDFAIGFFVPFWFIFVNDFGGGIQEFGYAISLMLVAGAFASLYTGKLSDKLGKRSVLITNGFGLAIVIFFYTLVSTTLQLYILQIFYGVMMSIQNTSLTAITGDLTDVDNRGSDVGRLHFFAQIASASAIFIAGIVGSKLGVEFVFYFTSLLMILSSILLFKITKK